MAANPFQGGHVDLAKGMIDTFISSNNLHIRNEELIYSISKKSNADTQEFFLIIEAKTSQKYPLYFTNPEEQVGYLSYQYNHRIQYKNDRLTYQPGDKHQIEFTLTDAACDSIAEGLIVKIKNCEFLRRRQNKKALQEVIDDVFAAANQMASNAAYLRIQMDNNEVKVFYLNKEKKFFEEVKLEDDKALPRFDQITTGFANKMLTNEELAEIALIGHKHTQDFTPGVIFEMLPLLAVPRIQSSFLGKLKGQEKKTVRETVIIALKDARISSVTPFKRPNWFSRNKAWLIPTAIVLALTAAAVAIPFTGGASLAATVVAILPLGVGTILTSTFSALGVAGAIGAALGVTTAVLGATLAGISIGIGKGLLRLKNRIQRRSAVSPSPPSDSPAHAADEEGASPAVGGEKQTNSTTGMLRGLGAESPEIEDWSHPDSPIEGVDSADEENKPSPANATKCRRDSPSAC